ncbi:alkaline phosphatase [Thermus thermophilus]|uniref:alkaline phosphatase n=2 Tax=Thermus thermophilus TaxID=274 RepID=UPI001950F9B6|nr:alkaline phosphatase [Thermus thermophilus]BCP98560.1 alkaline phosphatase [Thermus thermophilus]BCQ00891.1 alkaline phosphatase [Thermus thermophilus]
MKRLGLAKAGLAMGAAALFLAILGLGSARMDATDPGRVPSTRVFPTGNVIFFHPDGSGLNHWAAARLYFKGPDGLLNWDRLRYMAVYRGHMNNTLTGTSNGGATTHAFGYKVDGLGSFGKDGDGNLNPPTDRAIRSLSDYPGSIMREAANAGIPVGIVNDGHIAEPGTGAFLAEVGNRDNWQEITRQIIMGRPGMKDTAPWVVMGGGEADTRPKGATLLHRNVNQERGQPVNSRTSLRADDLDLEDYWNRQGSGNPSNDPLQGDDWIVVKTRAEFERLRQALRANPNYAPRVLGIFAYQDLFNDRNEEDLIQRGFVRPGLQPGQVGPNNQSRIVLWGDYDPAQPGYNPPTFAEMVEVAITILDRAARQQPRPENRRFFLVAEQEAVDNFGNNNNAVGVLHALKDTDDAIGTALAYLARNPNTLILTAADSDAGGLQVVAPNRSGVTPPTTVVPAGQETDKAGSVSVNPAAGAASVSAPVDGVEGRGTPLFLSAPDAFGKRMQFGVAWAGSPDFHGGILSRAAGLNASTLNSLFYSRFDNIDVYRLMYATLFGRLLDYPTTLAPTR